MSINYKYLSYIIVGLSVVNIVACNNSDKHEIRYLEEEKITNQVDQVFSSAKKFADGINTIGDVEQEFKQLNAEELKLLEEKREGSLFFSLLISFGIASEQSNLLLKTFFAANPTLDSSAQNHAVAMALLDAFLSNKRKIAKIPNTEYQEISLILARYPSLINYFSAADGSFDSQELSDVMGHLDQDSVIMVIPALEQAKLKLWFDWLLMPNNRQQAKAIFKSLYAKVSESEKTRLRNQLVASSQDLGLLIDEADDFGLKEGLAQDEYTLVADKPGNRYQGSLLAVLAHRAIRDGNDQDLAKLRTYAQKIKNSINDNSLYEAMLDNQIRERMKKALEPSKRQYFSNYFLAIDSPKDLVDAAAVSTNISNEQLARLYQLLIDNNNKAVELSQLYDSSGKGFIHLLLERPLDDQISGLVDQFLSAMGPVKEQEQLNNRGKNNDIEKPITLLAQHAKDSSNIASTKIFDRLFKNASITALDSLSDEKIKDYIVASLNKFLNGKNGADDFKKMYLKIDPNKHQLMRDLILEELISKGPLSIQRWLLSLADNKDYWGLYPGLANDMYKIGNKNGLLLYVLSAQSKNSNDYMMLRSYAQAINSALNSNNFERQIAAAKPVLLNQLATNNREDFADYYLAHDKVQNVYEAAGRPESKLSNSMLKELYELVIGNVESKAQLLAKDSLGINQDKFIHRLLKRSIDQAGDSLSLLISFLSTIGLNEEKIQLDDSSGGSKVFKLVAEHTRKNDDPAKKTLLWERLARNVVFTNLDGVRPVDLAAQVPLWLKNRAIFKQIYSLYPSNSQEAQAMRSKLVQEIYAQGKHKTKKFIEEISKSIDDSWGLGGGLDKDIYALERKPASAGQVLGPLLYVLTQRAIDDAQTNSSSYNFLSEYALSIKAKLAGTYENHLNTFWHGQTIIDMLKNALTPSKSYFADAYLARDGFNSLTAATIDKNFNNQDLRDLYLLTIAKDQNQAAQLDQQHDGNFINNLLERPADIYTKTILDAYIKSLDAISAQQQINSIVNGRYPLNRLLKDKPGDDPQAKALMMELLLVDKTAAATIDVADLSKTRFFSAGSLAQASFKKLYGYLNPGQQQALRSALVKDAYQAQKLPELIAQISEATDPWGLLTGLKTDLYEQSQHSGSLLQLLINVAMDDGNFAALKLSAEKIREAIERTAPGSYAQYAANFNEYSYLVMHLEMMADQGAGFAEYYLSLDSSVASLNADLVFRCSQIDKNSKQGLSVLNWLYQQIIKDEQSLRDLVAQSDSNNRNFLHLLSLKNSNNISLDLLKDFMDKSKNLDLNSLIAKTDKTGKNALHYLLDKNRTDKGSKQLNERILIMIEKSPDAIAAINDNLEIAMMLKTVANNANNNNLDLLFAKISNKTALAEWCADKRSKNIGERFLSSYQTASQAEQASMRNKLLNKAYDLGYHHSTIKGGLNNVAELIANDFFDEQTLKGSLFDPFNTGSDTSLLAALIAEVKPYTEADLSALIFAIKAKFATINDWQAYLNNNQIITQLLNFLPNKDINLARKLLKFD